MTDQQEIAVTFKARVAGPAPDVDQDGRQATVHGWAGSLAGPFDGIFSLRNARAAVAVNWGIAAAVYLLVGELIVRLLGRAHR
jgi:hypothetical protein